MDHSRLGDDNGTVFWDVDFTNGGGVTVNAKTGAVIATEAPGTDNGGHPPGTGPGKAPNGGQSGSGTSWHHRGGAPGGYTPSPGTGL